MGSIGIPELIVIFIVALLVFGPRKLPEIGKSLGKALAEFQRGRTWRPDRFNVLMHHQYTPSAGRIELEAFRQEQQAVLLIKDTGIGISPEEPPRIWDRLQPSPWEEAKRSFAERGIPIL
ncbi:MAG: hypothetical protein DMG06_13210 [Acidobacteria bacterium]|nr:MAG: hypothetical protein DMG06_13210 [Acidobacteriota bacterium]